MTEVYDKVLASLNHKSTSDKALILSLIDVLVAIDVLEQNGIRILGWEGGISDAYGNLGHGDAQQGTASLEQLTVTDAAQFCRQKPFNRALKSGWKSTQTPQMSFFSALWLKTSFYIFS